MFFGDQSETGSKGKASNGSEKLTKRLSLSRQSSAALMEAAKEATKSDQGTAASAAPAVAIEWRNPVGGNIEDSTRYLLNQFDPLHTYMCIYISFPCCHKSSWH